MLNLTKTAAHTLLFHVAWKLDVCLATRYQLLLKSDRSPQINVSYKRIEDTYPVRLNGKLILDEPLPVVLAYLDGLEEGLLASCLTQ